MPAALRKAVLAAYAIALTVAMLTRLVPIVRDQPRGALRMSRKKTPVVVTCQPNRRTAPGDTAPASHRGHPTVLDAAIAAATLAGVVLVARRAILFGSEAGNHFYIYVAPLGAETVAVAILGIPVVLGLHELARRYVDARPRLVLLATFAAGVALQLLLHRPYPHPMAETIVSDANSFYGAAELTRPLELLRDFDRLSTNFRVHARVNMPGKILFYHLLRVFTVDPRPLAVVIVAVSSLAGVLLYGIVASMFADRRLGIDAMVLWMIVPATISNYPMLNVVSPVPALVAVWCMTRFLAQPRAAWAVAVGVWTYVTVFFDPLALWLGVIFAPAIARAVLTGRVRPRDALLLLGLSAASLAAMDAVVRLGTGFDVWKRLRDMMELTRDFNRQMNRPYDVWLTANVKEVALAVGPAVTVSLAAACGHTVWKAWRARPRRALTAFLEPGPMVTLTTVMVLAVLVVLGLNRSEVARLWIFLFAAMQVVVAWWCAEQRGDVSRGLVVGGTFAYAAVTVATVGYCVP